MSFHATSFEESQKSTQGNTKFKKLEATILPSQKNVELCEDRVVVRWTQVENVMILDFSLPLPVLPEPYLARALIFRVTLPKELQLHPNEHRRAISPHVSVTANLLSPGNTQENVRGQVFSDGSKSILTIQLDYFNGNPLSTFTLIGFSVRYDLESIRGIPHPDNILIYPVFPNLFESFFRIEPSGTEKIIVGQMNPEVFRRLFDFSDKVFPFPVTLVSGIGPNVVYVPTQAELEGDFSSWEEPIVDPETRVPFPENRIPPDRLPRNSLGVFAVRFT
jgi:hypothetical protein